MEVGIRGSLFRSITHRISNPINTFLVFSWKLGDVKYFRYMDDILIPAPTRWKLKRAIRVPNETLEELKLETHPDKTMIGRTERGFDFLGYHFSPQGQSLADKTVNNFIEKALRFLLSQE